MRRAFAMFVLAAGVTTSAAAQQAWQREIGIQGGFVRIKPAGSGQNDHIDALSLPGSAYVLGLLTNGAFYVVIPWKEKIAIEPSLVFSQLSAVSTVTTGQFGLRANYALTPKVYAALGGELLYIESSIQRTKQLGLQGAVGYRMHLTGPLNARIEARFATRKKTEELTPNILYGALFGVSTRLRGTAAPSARRASGGRAWQRAIGISGGYVAVHGVGGTGDISGISLPGLGGSVTAAGTPLPNPPTMFAIFPIGSKTAIEPGLDLVRVQSNGTTIFSGNLSARLNYAVTRAWYAAAGGNLNYIKSTGADAASVTGVNLAWGYRFPFGAGFAGRVELNYTMFGKQTDLGIPPTNVFGVLIGASMPLR